MIISHDLKLIFLKTKKVGGTRFEIALSEITLSEITLSGLCGPDDVTDP